MTYYERGYLNAVVKEPERTGDGTLWFPEENYFKAYYQPLFELFADEQRVSCTEAAAALNWS